MPPVMDERLLPILKNLVRECQKWGDMLSGSTAYTEALDICRELEGISPVAAEPETPENPEPPEGTPETPELVPI